MSMLGRYTYLLKNTPPNVLGGLAVQSTHLLNIWEQLNT